MSAAARFVLASILLAATGASAAGAPPPAGMRVSDPVRKRHSASADPSAILRQLQDTLGRIAASEEPAHEDVTRLTRALASARGRTIADSALATLATALGTAVAQGSFDEESIERLAQNLYATVNSRELTSREGGMVILDVTGLLTEAGAEPPAVDAVIAALRAICPSGADRLDGISARASGPAVLTRR
jgi:hypothetical protein